MAKLWGVGMYQLHILDEWGRILRTREVACRDDDHARALAEPHVGLVPMELWKGGRVIERYEADLMAQAAPVED